MTALISQIPIRAPPKTSMTASLEILHISLEVLADLGESLQMSARKDIVRPLWDLSFSNPVDKTICVSLALGFIPRPSSGVRIRYWVSTVRIYCSVSGILGDDEPSYIAFCQLSNVLGKQSPLISGLTALGRRAILVTMDNMDFYIL
ncbi:hypothetical protein Tco_0367039 [Tanacetum coccineum]